MTLRQFFLIYFTSNVAFMFIGYEISKASSVPWLVVVASVVVAALLALNSARTLGNSYAREDRANAALQHVVENRRPS